MIIKIMKILCRAVRWMC